jgi:hypothetical protein
VASGEKNFQDDGWQQGRAINADLAIERFQKWHDLRLQLVVIDDRRGEAVREFLMGTVNWLRSKAGVRSLAQFESR